MNLGCLEDYARKARETAVYPDFYALEPAQIYVLNGVAAELSELMGKLVVAGERRKNLVMGELGDVCWYVAECCRVFPGLDIERVFSGTLRGAVEVGAVWDLSPTEMIALVMDQANVGSLMDKALRLDFGPFPAESGRFTAELERRLKAVMGVVRELSRRVDLKIEEILEANIAKLTDRKKRGKIRGSGDER